MLSWLTYTSPDFQILPYCPLSLPGLSGKNVEITVYWLPLIYGGSSMSLLSTVLPCTCGTYQVNILSSCRCICIKAAENINIIPRYTHGIKAAALGNFPCGLRVGGVTDIICLGNRVFSVISSVPLPSRLYILFLYIQESTFHPARIFQKHTGHLPGGSLPSASSLSFQC